MSLKLIIAGVLCVVFAAVLVELWLKRGKTPRPLAERMKHGMPKSPNADKPLGMEATDLEVVQEAQKANERAALANTKAQTKYFSNNWRKRK